MTQHRGDLNFFDNSFDKGKTVKFIILHSHQQGTLRKGRKGAATG